MSTNPFLNALSASAYIVLVASLMFYGSKIFGQGEDNVLMPIAMLSLFVLSAAIMGYLFLGRPAMLYLDGNKKPAVSLFVKTTAIFAVLTALAFLALFFLMR